MKKCVNNIKILLKKVVKLLKNINKIYYNKN